MNIRILTLLAAILSVPACAILPEHVDVAYASDPAVAIVPVPAPSTVRLDVADNRKAETPDWIADKKNGYGMRMANILAQKPVVDLVREAVTQELTARGVRVGGAAGSATVAVEIVRLDSVYQVRFFTVGAIGTANFAVQVRRADGNIAYARTFSVANDDEASMAGTAGLARRSVETALSKIVGQLMADPAFLKALAGAPGIA